MVFLSILALVLCMKNQATSCHGVCRSSKKRLRQAIACHRSLANAGYPDTSIVRACTAINKNKGHFFAQDGRNPRRQVFVNTSVFVNTLGASQSSTHLGKTARTGLWWNRSAGRQRKVVVMSFTNDGHNMSWPFTTVFVQPPGLLLLSAARRKRFRSSQEAPPPPPPASSDAAEAQTAPRLEQRPSVRRFRATVRREG